MVNLLDLERDGVDVAIRWGKGEWSDMAIEPLFACPAWPVAAPALAARIAEIGLEAGLEEALLLDDRDGSAAWSEWLERAGLLQRARRGRLTIPDPNVRVQAVIDGQGIAINDRLVQPEIEAGLLRRISEVELTDLGYHLAVPPAAAADPDVVILIGWLHDVARDTGLAR